MLSRFCEKLDNGWVEVLKWSDQTAYFHFLNLRDIAPNFEFFLKMKEKKLSS